MRLRPKRYWAWGPAWAAVFLISAAGCGNDTGAAGSTGIRVNVTVAEGHEHLDGQLDSLRFYVAVRAPGVDTVWRFDHDATGTQAEIPGRSLLFDPFRHLLKEDGDGVMEVVRVFVFAFVDGQIRAWGQLEEPAEQPFLVNRIVDRTVFLKDPEIERPPFNPIVSDMGCWYVDGVRIESPNDQDCDGYPSWEDCDDSNGMIRPGAIEVCYNLVDDDCDGVTDEIEDNDQDSFSNCDGDCDDEDPTVYPGAPERCDGKDNDCNGMCDETFDVDGDGYTVCGEFTGTFIKDDGTCEEGGPSEALRDCAPNDPEIHPFAEEICDGKDNDCNGECDERFDQDQDGWTTCGSKYESPDPALCQPPAEWAEDCNDGDETVHPGQPEICDGKETNCDPADDLNGWSQVCLAWVDEGGGNFVCKEGTRTCEDLNGHGWGDCDTSSSTGDVPPPAFCDLYEICLTTDPENPYQCVLDGIGQTQAMCHVFSATSNTTCGDPPLYPLPEPDPTITRCDWYLYDTAPGWNVSLWRWDSNAQAYVAAGPNVTSCQVALMAEPTDPVVWQGGNPQYVQLIFVGDQGVEVEVWDVGLTVMNGTCSPGVDMDCTGL